MIRYSCLVLCLVSVAFGEHCPDHQSCPPPAQPQPPPPQFVNTSCLQSPSALFFPDTVLNPPTRLYFFELTPDGHLVDKDGLSISPENEAAYLNEYGLMKNADVTIWTKSFDMPLARLIAVLTPMTAYHFSHITIGRQPSTMGYFSKFYTTGAYVPRSR